MSRIARFAKWLAPDLWSGVAAASCVIPFIGPASRFLLPDLSSLHWLDAVTQVVLLPLAFFMVAYPQILMTLILRSLDSPVARMVGALASLVLAIWYAIWAAGADLSGSSTAPLGLIFFQIVVQGWAWALALVLVLIVGRLDDEEKQ